MTLVTLGLAGDTMLGRKVAEAIDRNGPDSVVADEVVALTRSADLFVLNLECCISSRGSPWPDPQKPFFFRAPPEATEVLTRLGVDCVTLANNHALDFDRVALLTRSATCRRPASRGSVQAEIPTRPGRRRSWSGTVSGSP